ncbi:DUF4097 family beta strand repeat-containing protein [Streptomyces formicae]|uniref:DUF4097 domain-containing protein n=1 Tax=Streptomyces formicae TaxID=1616117 RepID=A0A291QGT9_9ACTN|nr:DUF4097 family beta strand repeat-containing protein [Streptomyces formicae]ATL30726.1 hypothetical protein KY5_5708 [Streptomyces formicae]
MPAFETPEPISASVEFSVGSLRVVAEDRADTVVEVRPTDGSSDQDVKTAGRVRVEFANGKLLVKGPKERSLFSRTSPSVDVEILLPAGSELRAVTAMGGLAAHGRLGDCAFRTGAGDIQVEQAGELDLNTAYGEVSVGRAAGAAEIATSSGEVRVGEAAGTARIKNSNGPTKVGEVAGDLTVRASNGSVTVDHAGADVTVKTANGPITVGELVRGSTVLESAAGRIAIGVREGTAAWLDVRTKAGTVRQSLEESGTPSESTDTLKVRARTMLGDIVIHRA